MNVNSPVTNCRTCPTVTVDDCPLISNPTAHLRLMSRHFCHSKCPCHPCSHGIHLWYSLANIYIVCARVYSHCSILSVFTFLIAGAQNGTVRLTTFLHGHIYLLSLLFSLSECSIWRVIGQTYVAALEN